MSSRGGNKDDDRNFSIAYDFSCELNQVEPEDIEIENSPSKEIEMKIEDKHWNEDISADNRNNESVKQTDFDEIKIEIDDDDELPREQTIEELYQPSTSINNENDFMQIKVEIDDFYQMKLNKRVILVNF